MAVDGIKLNIIDEEGNIIGEATREEIHKKGLLHKEAHAWFYTPKGEIIFQRRAKDKDTFPNRLDAAAAGHVEKGSDYLETAVKEIEEETGLKVSPEELTFIGYLRSTAHDPETRTINNRIAGEFAFYYEGELRDLRIEADKAQGFETWPIDRVLAHMSEDKDNFIPTVFAGKLDFIFKRLKELWREKTN